MARGSAWYFVAPLVALTVAGCRFSDYEERDPWRTQAEEECLARQAYQPSAFVEQGSELNGAGSCGIMKPLKVVALSQGFVTVNPTAQLGCPIVAGVEYWFEHVVQPQAEAWFGEPVVEIRQISAYSCRTMNGQRGASISEHAYGNALDISTFKLQSGREVTVKAGWNGAPEERGFLRNIHAQACDFFSTVLGPGADAFHYDHLHVDLSRRSSGRSVCNPTPRDVPQAPRMSRGVPMVQRGPMPAPVASAPVRPTPSNAMQGMSPPERLAAANDPYAASTSPFAKRGSEPMRGPSVITRDETMRVPGQPMQLGQQPPPHNSFGAPMSVEQRALQTFAPPPGMQRPVPPGSVGPNAKKSDPVTTGSIKSAAPASKAKPAANLLSPKPMAEELEGKAETMTVFNLPGAKKN
jgi:hypothetical protein